MRPRRAAWPAVEQWPPWIWSTLTHGHGVEERQPAFDWCAERGYNPLLVLGVVRAHRSALAGAPPESARCPCPLHMTAGASFPSPAELERQRHRGGR